MRTQVFLLLISVFPSFAAESALRGFVSVAKAFPALERHVFLPEPSGGMFVVGQTSQSGLPITDDAPQKSFGIVNCGIVPGKPITFANCPHLYLAKLSPSGAVQFATYLGSDGLENFLSAAVTSDGGLLLLGVTTSDNFTIPLAGTPTGRLRNFLMRVGPNGKDVKFARILPFGQTALPYVVTLDAQDNIFVAGTTDSAGVVATAGSAQPSVNGKGDGFIAAYSAAGDPVWTTYLGGSEADSILYLVVQGGRIYASGLTFSTDFPLTPGAWTRVAPSLFPVARTFVSILSQDGSSLLASSYFASDTGDSVFSFAVGPDGSTVLAGQTISRSFPATNTFGSSAKQALTFGFIVKLKPDLSAPVFSILITGEGGDAVYAAIPAPDGTVLAAGTTSSRFFPVTKNALERCNTVIIQTLGSGFLARITADGTSLVYSSYFNTGSQPSSITALHQDSAGRLVIEELGNGFDLGYYGNGRFDSPNQIIPFVLVLDPATVPSRSRLCVANSASLAGGQVAPGELITLFGTEIGPLSPVSSSLPLLTQLAGTRILVDGTAAPMLYADGGQVNTSLPESIGETGNVNIEVEVNGTVVDSVSLPITPVAASLFRRYPSIAVAAVNEDGSPNSADQPAAPGSLLTLFGTGFGVRSADGSPLHPVNIYLNAKQVENLSVSQVPDVPGLISLAFRVPNESAAFRGPKMAEYITVFTVAGFQNTFLQVWLGPGTLP
jgi:uncharacterized protein (TIGR03437 family)